MRTLSKGVKKKSITILIPETVYDGCVEAAVDAGQSLSAWIRFAVTAYLKRWQKPAGTVASAGLDCTHPACLVPAIRCKAPKEHKEQGMWV